MPQVSPPEQFLDLLSTVGKGALNAIFPQEFEYYSMGLELVNSRGETEEYFMFPVMPQQISYSQVHQNNTSTTSKGNFSTTNPNFIPKRISIKGDFGVKFRLMIGKSTNVEGRAFSFSTESGSFPTINTNILSAQIKRGFGAIKILEGICEKSDYLDNDKKPYTLYLYNTALSHSFVVKVKNLNLEMGMERNRVWGYDLTLEALAPLSAESIKDESFNRIGLEAINKSTGILANNIGDLISGT